MSLETFNETLDIAYSELQNDDLLKHMDCFNDSIAHYTLREIFD